ncbi:hypothetical protein L3X38_041505 [Prunus dulcis]|uniref:Uncharacterized protein n=1 Tax=Prunus dulcis TaxID=3755 RepID=A0AAD4UV21_PRUDU|nr:hypothetical protein L3X38_041505 [Prunus dulcis]
MSSSFPCSLDLNIAQPIHTFARSLVTPMDVRVLGTRDDNRLVRDAMALSVQSVASIGSVGHRLIANSHEVQVLRAQLTAKQDLEENEKLSKIVSVYSKDMQKQLEALENPGKHKRDHKRSSRVNAVIISSRVNAVIIRGSSDEPQVAMSEDPREGIKRAKLKFPAVKK